eukprot:CAMPEP_0206531318 /NCGR_PEP_ID=MMETSP0325_2-20121206/3691_1 /ASSEMBLY_ACC=CAM_ASM_000347 /TAXON_ID=2866 /ORGANISM="Crypthecodinium cohnii, Strain Seligo" /LENGTH=323 /DNA_ID=CAMNT_0054027533 /DNA_START=337 /DNA_END=1305 /DNA_ORIENTATION=+
MAPGVSVRSPCLSNKGDRPAFGQDSDRGLEQPRATPPAPFAPKVQRQFTPLTYRVKDEDDTDKTRNEILKKPVISRELDRQRHAGGGAQSGNAYANQDNSDGHLGHSVHLATLSDSQPARSLYDSGSDVACALRFDNSASENSQGWANRSNHLEPPLKIVATPYAGPHLSVVPSLPNLGASRPPIHVAVAPQASPNMTLRGVSPLTTARSVRSVANAPTPARSSSPLAGRRPSPAAQSRVVAPTQSWTPCVAMMDPQAHTASSSSSFVAPGATATAAATAVASIAATAAAASAPATAPTSAASAAISAATASISMASPLPSSR